MKKIVLTNWIHDDSHHYKPGTIGTLLSQHGDNLNRTCFFVRFEDQIQHILFEGEFTSVEEEKEEPCE